MFDAFVFIILISQILFCNVFANVCGSPTFISMWWMHWFFCSESRARGVAATAIVTFCSLWPLPCVKYLTYLTCFHCVWICPSLTPPGVRKLSFTSNRFRLMGAGGVGSSSFLILSVDLPDAWLPFILRNPPWSSADCIFSYVSHSVGRGDLSFVCVLGEMGDVSQNVSFQRASSFATGIVLQRYAITALRRLTKGGQSPHMWRQWFYFSRMFGIVFLPAQSGRACPVDSRSSWQRNSWLNGRRLMENRHWTLIPLFSFPLLTGTGIDKQNTQKTQKETDKYHRHHTEPTFTIPSSHPCLIPDPPPHFLLLSLCHAVSHTVEELRSYFDTCQLAKQLPALPIAPLTAVIEITLNFLFN